MVKRSAKEMAFALLRFVPLIVCITLFAAYLLGGQDITAESILSGAPSNPWLAAAFLLLLYAAKSLSIVFPMLVLTITGGFLFPPAAAILVNSLGVLIALALPYWVGRVSGADLAEKFVKKYPKLAEVVSFQQGNALFLSFFLRVISCLPGDAVSMYLGAGKLRFPNICWGVFWAHSPTSLRQRSSETASPIRPRRYSGRRFC